MDVGFFFQAEDGIRDLVRSRGLGDVYKRQVPVAATGCEFIMWSGDLSGSDEPAILAVDTDYDLSLIHI